MTLPKIPYQCTDMIRVSPSLIIDVKSRFTKTNQKQSCQAKWNCYAKLEVCGSILFSPYWCEYNVQRLIRIILVGIHRKNIHFCVYRSMWRRSMTRIPDIFLVNLDDVALYLLFGRKPTSKNKWKSVDLKGLHI